MDRRKKIKTERKDHLRDVLIHLPEALQDSRHEPDG